MYDSRLVYLLYLSFWRFLHKEWALNLMCSRDPPASCQPTAGLSTNYCSGSCQEKALIPRPSCQEPSWGLCSGLTVVLSCYISQELGLSRPLPVRICLNNSKQKKKKFEKAQLPVVLRNKSTTAEGRVFVTLFWAMIPIVNNGIHKLLALNHFSTTEYWWELILDIQVMLWLIYGTLFMRLALTRPGRSPWWNPDIRAHAMQAARNEPQQDSDLELNIVTVSSDFSKDVYKLFSKVCFQSDTIINSNIIDSN